MKKQWIIGGIVIVILGLLPLKAQEPKSMKLDSDIVEKPKQVITENYKETPFGGVVEKMPVFPGGYDSLLNFIRKNLRLDPKIDYGNGIPGKVFIRFIITKTGEVTKVEVLRSLDPTCDKEAIRVVKLLPNFIPGEQNGKKVDVYYTLPVSFKPYYYEK